MEITFREWLLKRTLTDTKLLLNHISTISLFIVDIRQCLNLFNNFRLSMVKDRARGCSDNRGYTVLHSVSHTHLSSYT